LKGVAGMSMTSSPLANFGSSSRKRNAPERIKCLRRGFQAGDFAQVHIRTEREHEKIAAPGSVVHYDFTLSRINFCISA
jgi:hypothetical protein